MNKYKVEFIQTKKFIVDVEAENETVAIEKARIEWDKITKNETDHFHRVGDTETEVGTIYDVTNTDDPFDPIKQKTTHDKQKTIQQKSY